MKRLWHFITLPYRNWQYRRFMKKRIEELKKRDPFIYQ